MRCQSADYTDYAEPGFCRAACGITTRRDCEKVAGGRSEAETTGHVDDRSHAEGVPDVLHAFSVHLLMISDPVVCGPPATV